MEWQEEGVLLARRPHGESAAIIEVFTPGHGRHQGVVRGGASRRLAPHLEPGNQLHLSWSARLSEHLGTFTVEPVRSRAHLLGDRLALAALNAITALCHVALPERSPAPGFYARTQTLLDRLGTGQGWPADYARWELALLDEIGAGLDLSACAVTGSRRDLVFVSPRSGRAVSRQGAGDWADRLLPLPAFLLHEHEIAGADAAPPAPGDLAAALHLSAVFLERGLEPVLAPRPLPQARSRLVALLTRPAGQPRPD